MFSCNTTEQYINTAVFITVSFPVDHNSPWQCLISSIIPLSRNATCDFASYKKLDLFMANCKPESLLIQSVGRFKCVNFSLASVILRIWTHLFRLIRTLCVVLVRKTSSGWRFWPDRVTWWTEVKYSEKADYSNSNIVMFHWLHIHDLHIHSEHDSENVLIISEFSSK